jgi:cardiolipin synthase
VWGAVGVTITGEQLVRYGTQIATALIVLIQVALIPLVLVRRKEASSTIAWILTLVFIPLLGAFLFLLFGRDRVRMGASNKRRAKAASRERLQGVVRSRRGGVVPIAREPSEELAAGVSSSELGRAEPTGDPSADVALTFENAELESRLELLDPVDRPIFRVGGRLGHMAATTENEIDVMASAEDATLKMFAAIAEAKTSVHAEYYLVRDDATGRAFRDLLVAAAKRGVRVRLLVDGFGGLALDATYVDAFEEAGVEMARFLPIRALGAGLHARLLGAFQWNLRNHRKILVVDGRIAFTGGVNIGDDVRSWRDTHVRIEGPAVHSLQAIFLEDWEFATGKPVADVDDFPSFPPEARASQRTSEMRARGIVEIVASGPDTANEAIHRVFFAAITGAHERVLITTPYFVPDRALIVALQTAALSGVDVRMIVPAKSNHRVTAAAGRSYYEECLEAGVGIYEYLPGMIHSKTIVVDGRIALVGSANMDMRSFRLNYEVHAVVRDAEAAMRLERTFHEDLAQTRKLELATWRARGLSARIAEGAGRLVAPLL